MKRKSSPKVQATPVESKKPLPVRQLKALRSFGVRQLAAAFEMVGLGELFIDQTLAIGFALKIQKERLSSAQLADIMTEGAEYLASRGILEIDPPPKPSHGDVEVIIRAPTINTTLSTGLIAAGLKARTIGSDGLITQFKGRLPRHSSLLDKVRTAHGTVAVIENPHVLDALAAPIAATDGGQGSSDATTTVSQPMMAAAEPAISQAVEKPTTHGGSTEGAESEPPPSEIADAIAIHVPAAPKMISEPSAHVIKQLEKLSADMNRFRPLARTSADQDGKRGSEA